MASDVDRDWTMHTDGILLNRFLLPRSVDHLALLNFIYILIIKESGSILFVYCDCLLAWLRVVCEGYEACMHCVSMATDVGGVQLRRLKLDVFS